MIDRSRHVFFQNLPSLNFDHKFPRGKTTNLTKQILDRMSQPKTTNLRKVITLLILSLLSISASASTVSRNAATVPTSTKAAFIKRDQGKSIQTSFQTLDKPTTDKSM